MAKILKMKVAMAIIGTVIVMLILGVLVFNVTSMTFLTTGTRTEISAETITSSIRQMSDFLTLSNDYRDIIRFSDQDYTTILGVDIALPGTARSFIALFDGSIRMGVDADEIAVTVEEYAIYITIPEAEILIHSVDMESIEIIDQTTGVFAEIEIELFVDLVIEQMAIREEVVHQSDMLTQAHANAQEAISGLILGLLTGLGLEEEYTIVFR